MFIVFDIGGTNTRIAASQDGKTLGQIVIYPTPQDFPKGIEQLVDSAKKLANGAPILGMAGGVPGPMDLEHTQILTAPNIKDWCNKPLKKELEERLGTKVYLENDTAMWGLGEASTGAGAGKDVVVYMTVSTEVGGTRIVNGKIDRGVYGFEPGHQIIDPSGPLCGCGGQGHLEAMIGGAAMTKRYGISPKDITDEKIWEEAARILAIGILNMCMFWSPRTVILGGSMMRSISIERILLHMKTLNHILPELPGVSISTLGDSGGLIGSLSYLSSKTKEL